MTEHAPRAPLAAERRAHVLAALGREGVVRVADLVAELGVTPVTIRRDIANIEAEGLLHRVHGGAVVRMEGEEGVRDGGRPSPTTSVGVLVPSLDYYWPGVVRGVEAAAAAQGLRTQLRGSSYEAADERPAVRRLVETDGVRGLLLAPNTDSPHAQDLLQWLATSGVPSVLVEREGSLAPHREALESVTTDHALGALMAVHHLADLGHRRVGLVLSRQSPTSRKIAAGWRRACAQLELAANEHFERTIPDRRQPDFSDIVDSVLETALSSGTTALLVHSDPDAMAFVQHAQDRGVSVPGDLSVVAYDDEVARLYSPALTAVSPPRAAVGHAAVDLLVKRLADPTRPVHRVVLSPQLVVRESTAPAHR
ncbi:substrate-binding domain-containing protein [Xylanimonas sp. McL0601]|uniref:LacI family DNA-binding transcriptional regulator n=1 Tax=Xylanimonas sp. McL0601 TaxID=3414739 RepID=UPI003CFB4414